MSSTRHRRAVSNSQRRDSTTGHAGGRRILSDNDILPQGTLEQLEQNDLTETEQITRSRFPKFDDNMEAHLPRSTQIDHQAYSEAKGGEQDDTDMEDESSEKAVSEEGAEADDEDSEADQEEANGISEDAQIGSSRHPETRLRDTEAMETETESSEPGPFIGNGDIGPEDKVAVTTPDGHVSQLQVMDTQLSEERRGWAGSSQRPSSLYSKDLESQDGAKLIDDAASDDTDKALLEQFEHEDWTPEEFKEIARSAPPGDKLSDGLTPSTSPVKNEKASSTKLLPVKKLNVWDLWKKSKPPNPGKCRLSYNRSIADCFEVLQTDPQTLKRLLSYIRNHDFIVQQCTADFTTSQRRQFERDVADVGAGLGLNRHVVKAEIKKAKQYLSRDGGHDSDDSTLSEEIDDTEQSMKSLFAAQGKRRRHPRFLSVVDVGDLSATISLPPDTVCDTWTPVTSDLRVKYALTVSFIQAPKFNKAEHTLAATQDRSKYKISGEAPVSRLHSELGDWIATDLQDAVTNNAHLIERQRAKERSTRAKSGKLTFRPSLNENANSIAANIRTDKDTNTDGSERSSSKKLATEHTLKKPHRSENLTVRPRTIPHREGIDDVREETLARNKETLVKLSNMRSCGLDSSLNSPSDEPEDGAEQSEQPQRKSVTATKQTAEAASSTYSVPIPASAGKGKGAESINSAERAVTPRECQEPSSQTTKKKKSKHGLEDEKSQREKDAIAAEAHVILDNMSAVRKFNNRQQLAAYESGNLGTLSRKSKADFEQLKSDQRSAEAHEEVGRKIMEKEKKEKKRKRNEAQEQQPEVHHKEEHGSSTQVTVNKKRRSGKSKKSKSREGPDDILSHAGADVHDSGDDPHHKRMKHEHAGDENIEDHSKSKKSKKQKKKKSSICEDFHEPRTQ